MLGKSKLGTMGSGRFNVNGYSSGLSISYQPLEPLKERHGGRYLVYLRALAGHRGHYMSFVEKVKDDADRGIFRFPPRTIVASCLLCLFV